MWISAKQSYSRFLIQVLFFFPQECEWNFTHLHDFFVSEIIDGETRWQSILFPSSPFFFQFQDTFLFLTSGSYYPTGNSSTSPFLKYHLNFSATFESYKHVKLKEDVEIVNFHDVRFFLSPWLIRAAGRMEERLLCAPEFYSHSGYPGGGSCKEAQIPCSLYIYINFFFLKKKRFNRSREEITEPAQSCWCVPAETGWRVTQLSLPCSKEEACCG